MPEFTAKCGCILYGYIYQSHGPCDLCGDEYDIEDVEMTTPCKEHGG
jgi:hypothetical protein